MQVVGQAVVSITKHTHIGNINSEVLESCSGKLWTEAADKANSVKVHKMVWKCNASRPSLGFHDHNFYTNWIHKNKSIKGVILVSITQQISLQDTLFSFAKVHWQNNKA